MDIIKQTSTANTTVAPGRKILYIVEHYTAGVTSKKGSARNTADWFSQSRAQASADFIVDDAQIVQFNPDPENRYCWAVGGGHYGNKGGRLYGVAKNANTISIEICSTNKTGKVTNANDSNWYFTDAVLDRAVEITQYLMKKYGIDADHVIRHYDVNGKPCPGIIGWNAETGDESKWEAFQERIRGDISAGKEGLQASSLKGLTEKAVVDKVGSLFTADQKKSGILASVSMAQFILESGYGKTQLAQNANNCFGMKKSLTGNTWSGSTWDGVSTSTRKTQEDDGSGNLYTITADFRKYACVEDSIADHSAYLLGAKNGSALRYAGLKGETDYKKAIQIIKDGGYATDTKYVSKICTIIEKWNLTQYDVAESNTAEHLYRVRKDWNDSDSQIGAYKVLDNAKAECDKHLGYSVYDWNGKAVYSAAGAKFPYLVRITIPDLNIREKPAVSSRSHGFTGKGVFTIVEEQDGWGLLKSYAKKSNGWIKLSYTQRL